MSARRGVPVSLIWLAGLVLLAVAAAVAAGVILYAQEQAQVRRRAEGLTGGDVQAGKAAIARYGCGGCHMIPGVAGAAGKVGPPLTGVAVRAQIAGRLPNDPEAMARWLEHPQRIAPGAGMPEMGVTSKDAHDMAAYLYTLR